MLAVVISRLTSSAFVTSLLHSLQNLHLRFEFKCVRLCCSYCCLMHVFFFCFLFNLDIFTCCYSHCVFAFNYSFVVHIHTRISTRTTKDAACNSFSLSLSASLPLLRCIVRKPNPNILCGLCFMHLCYANDLLDTLYLRSAVFLFFFQ